MVQSPDDMSSQMQQGNGARATANFQRQKGEADKKHAWRGSEPHAAHSPAAYIAAPRKARDLVSSDDVAVRKIMLQTHAPNSCSHAYAKSLEFVLLKIRDSFDS